MTGQYMAITVLHALMSIAWVLLDFVIAGIVIWRFRSTASSWLIAGGFVAFALVRVVNSAFSWLVMPHLEMDLLLVNVISNGLFMSLYAVVCLVVACGVALIPRSLRRLSAARSS